MSARVLQHETIHTCACTCMSVCVCTCVCVYVCMYVCVCVIECRTITSVIKCFFLIGQFITAVRQSTSAQCIYVIMQYKPVIQTSHTNQSYKQAIQIRQRNHTYQLFKRYKPAIETSHTSHANLPYASQSYNSYKLAIQPGHTNDPTQGEAILTLAACYK